MKKYPSEKALNVIYSSYTELQQLTGIDKAVWSHYFNGRRWADYSTFKAIAETFELETTDFIAAFLVRRDETIAKKLAKRSGTL